MSVSWAQKDVKYKKNQAFIDWATKLMPRLFLKEIPLKNVYMGGKNKMGLTMLPEDFIKKAWQRGDSFILDYGQNIAGRLSLKLDFEGSPYDAPAFIKLKFCEHERELFDESSDYNGWIGKGWIQEEWLHIDEFPITLNLPRRYAFRFIRVDVLDTSQKYRLVVSAAKVVSETSAGENKAVPIKAPDALLKDIDNACIRTLSNCMQLVFEDGPKRDRRLWIGDLRLQALVNYVTFQNNDLVKRCLYLFAGLTRDNDMVASCLYAEPRLGADDIFLLDYSLFFVDILLDYWMHTGDRKTLEDLYGTAIRQIEIAEEFIQDSGIIMPEGEYHCFIDWKDGLDKQAAMHGIYMYTLKQGEKLCNEVGDSKTATALRFSYEAAKAAAISNLWDEENKYFTSGETRQLSVASQVWMCLAGAIDNKEAGDLLLRINDINSQWEMVTPYMYHHYVLALINCGKSDKATDVIKSYWGGMLAQGADTFWELFSPDNPFDSPYGSSAVNSYCHAWSCTPSWLLRKMKQQENCGY